MCIRDSAYPESKEVLKDFCCTIRKGEYVGICGESGVGKSTLFYLLLGFITPDKGAIRIDGRPLADVPRQEWHRRVGYVQQEVFVLDGTLAENIALGCRSIDKERVAEIVRQVRLDAWVDELPQGIDTPLGEGGGRLSGGQKQRVGIARALYKKAEVLLLDEATSALDNADVGSSIRITSGSTASVLAIQSLCCCPPESPSALLFRRSLSSSQIAA